MKILDLTTSALFMLALTTPALADLGETEQELKKRFGNPTKTVDDQEKVAPADKQLIFKTPSSTVIVAVLDGKAVYEEYVFDEDIKGPNDPKVKAILDRQSKSGAWDLFPDPKLIGPDRKYVWGRIEGAQEKWANASVRTSAPKSLELQTHNFTLLLKK